MHNADIQMWHMCACRWLYQYVIFKYPRVLVRVCVNLQPRSCEQAWCCIKFCCSVYRDEQYSFSLLMAVFTQRCQMCSVSAVLVNCAVELSHATFTDVVVLIACVMPHPDNTLNSSDPALQ